MSNIRIIEKPDWIAYDDIVSLMQEAHRENYARGLKINSKITDGEALKYHLGENAVCFVAVDGERLLGTVSVNIRKGMTFLTKHMDVAYLMHLAVLPDSTGRNLGRELCNKVEEYAQINGASLIELIVVEKNPARAFYEHIGYAPISYLARKSLQQYSVVMAKELDGSNTPAILFKTQFICKKAICRVKYRYN